MEQITILITDDHILVRQTWKIVLNADPRFLVVGECSTGEQAIGLASEFQPDVIIMDINLPGISGIEATRLICKSSPASKILGVSFHLEPIYARNLMMSGAAGYVTKSSTLEEMFKAILEVHNGGKYICDEIKNIISEQMITEASAVPSLGSLTDRELEVVKLIIKGLSSREIADLFNLSVKTVEVHRYNILKKLGLKNTVALIKYVNENSLLG